MSFIYCILRILPCGIPEITGADIPVSCNVKRQQLYVARILRHTSVIQAVSIGERNSQKIYRRHELLFTSKHFKLYL